MDYLIGFIFGLAVAFALAWLCLVVRHKDRERRHVDDLADVQAVKTATVVVPGMVPARALLVIKPTPWLDPKGLADSIRYNNGKGVILCFGDMGLEPELPPLLGTVANGLVRPDWTPEEQAAWTPNE